MKTLEVSELTKRINEILRMVEEEGETIELTKRGQVVAHLIPAVRPQQPIEHPTDDAWSKIDRLGAEISAHWPKGVSAVDAVRDVRREL